MLNKTDIYQLSVCEVSCATWLKFFDIRSIKPTQSFKEAHTPDDDESVGQQNGRSQRPQSTNWLTTTQYASH